MHRHTLPPVALWLGLAGLLPQVICVLLVALGGPYRWIGLAAGCFYAAIILSFLGGMWWMAALMNGQRRIAPYFIAVCPSLIGWAALLPWAVGWKWPEPSLILIGAALLASPIIDHRIAATVEISPAWLKLRMALATGLAALTWLIAVA